MTRAEYLQVLTAFEARLRRHTDVTGKLLPIAPHVQDLRAAWDRTFAALRVEYPDEPLPVPFWEQPEPSTPPPRHPGDLAMIRFLVLWLLKIEDRKTP